MSTVGVFSVTLSGEMVDVTAQAESGLARSNVSAKRKLIANFFKNESIIFSVALRRAQGKHWVRVGCKEAKV